MNERAAKAGVWAYLILTLTSFALTLYFLLFRHYESSFTFVLVSIWLGYLAFTLFRSAADMLGPQRRTANFTRMLDRWQDAFGKRSSALALLTFMTLVVGGVKLAVPFILIQF